MPTSRDERLGEELASAAADLEALTLAFDERTRLVGQLEGALDAILDDPDLRVCLVAADLEVRGVSRGMTSLWPEADKALGRRLDEVAPSSWGDVSRLVRDAADDGWTEHPVDDGVIHARRATVAGDPDTVALIVLRLVGG
jgi:hypothetical protein